jgi:hypothetical protein
VISEIKKARSLGEPPAGLASQIEAMQSIKAGKPAGQVDRNNRNILAHKWIYVKEMTRNDKMGSSQNV